MLLRMGHISQILAAETVTQITIQLRLQVWDSVVVFNLPVSTEMLPTPQDSLPEEVLQTHTLYPEHGALVN